MEGLEVHAVKKGHENRPRGYHSSKSRPVSKSGNSPKSSSSITATRPGTIPLLWDHESPLTVQSAPVSLATRSLSSRTSSSTTSAKQIVSNSRKQSNSTRKQDRLRQGTSVVHPASSSDGLKSGLSNTTATSGFNITTHLRGDQGGAVMDRSNGSISPEVDQFLQDINAAIRSATPDSAQSKQHSARATSSSRNKPALVGNLPKNAKPSDTTLESRKHNRRQAEQTLTHYVSPEQAVYLTSDDSETSEHTKQQKAAITIQKWYRGTRHKQLAQVQSLLHSKREALNRSRVEEVARADSEAEVRQEREAERERRRLAKMQEARRTAIEGLQRKREEKRKQNEKIAQEEIALLQSSGKIKRPRTSQRKKTKKHEATLPTGSARRKEESPEDTARVHKGGRDEVRKDVKLTGDDVIDQFFEAGNIRRKTPPQPHVTAAVASSKTGNEQTKTTYSDILETLKLLEEVPEPLTTTQSYLSSSNLAQLTTLSLPPGELSEGKLQSILTYLEQMERADSDLLSQVSKSQSLLKAEGPPATNLSLKKPTQQSNLRSKPTDDTLSSELEAATAVASDVTTTILAQRLELENKDKTVEMLQKALTQQRELTVYHAKEMDKEGGRRLALQKQEYEGTIQRHQCFIDQLIDDKKVLSERCEKLVKELREVDAKYKQKIKVMTDSHAAELAKLKQVSAAADKLRREKWRTEETQRIKEATVKSLEPEIQRIIAKGKAEIQKLKALHEAEMLQVDERAGRRFVAQMEELRAQCAAEKEQACSHERELARQRFEKLAEQEELNYQQQRRRLYAEVQQEKDKQATQFHRQKENLEQRYREMQSEQDRVVEELKSEHVRAFGEVERRHSSELREVRERVDIEKQAWEENMLKRQEAILMARQREMKEAERRERDKEIEMVITRLEEETALSREEGERALEGRIRRVRDKYETELREVERSERTTLEKFNTMKLQVMELESEVARVQSLLRRRDQEIEQVGQVATKLTSERDHVADVVRQEFADRLVSTEETNKQLKIEMSELRARHKIELDRVGVKKDKDMEVVHERIKQALTKKEENLKSLRQQYDAATKRAEHLEMLLERQRKQLLTK